MNPSILRALAFAAAGAVITLAVIYGAGRFFGSSPTMTEPDSAQSEILYWVAPMDTTYRRDEPGLSPMGMELVPVYADSDSGGDEDGLRIDPAVANNIGVRTDFVKRTDFSREIRAVGYVRPIDASTVAINVRAEGWIETLPVSAVGDQVQAGDALFTLYSPAIATAQGEFLQAQRTERTALISASRSRLRALGLSSAQIGALTARGAVQDRLPVYSSHSGVVTELSVREGQYVRPGDPIMTIADLSDIWVVLDVFEHHASDARPGQSVLVTTPSLPARQWRGEIEYVYPTVDPQTRTIRVRSRIANRDGDLRPGMFVNAVLSAQPRTGVLSVSREAVITTARSQRVIVLTGEDRFIPARVETGMESGGRTEILSGLSEGETIVVSGQFLLDSEASLQGAILRMTPPGPTGDSARPLDEQPSPMSMPDPSAASPGSGGASDGGDMNMEMPGARDGDVDGVGAVISVMPQHGMVTLAHEPIPALSWPAMEMAFTAAQGVELSGLAPGDRVRFTLVNDEGRWLISHIVPDSDEEGGQ